MNYLVILLPSLVALLWPLLPASAQMTSEASKSVTSSTPQRQLSDLPLAPSNREPNIAASRGQCSNGFIVEILAPTEYIGLTESTTPRLYWFQSRRTRDPVQISIQGTDGFVFHKQKMVDGQSGINSVEFPGQLPLGAKAFWSVAVTDSRDGTRGCAETSMIKNQPSAPLVNRWYDLIRIKVGPPMDKVGLIEILKLMERYHSIEYIRRLP